ncbi:MAG: phosphatidylserine/phosphatidylglycerophosphate/cardiolipin synthase family protein [Bacteroidales bacterium]|nr:phosphatidylserine/phosphatidylglycerophosphate/cardiolipin synthase family protein [Bacteroidales bacterium]
MQNHEEYKLWADPMIYYPEMIKDILAAKKYVYIETFRLTSDAIGERFKNALIKVRKKGVAVRLLIDYWGAGSVKNGFLDELIKLGAEVRFFVKIKLSFDFFTRSHRRNHRKLLLVDDTISYIGSSNLTGYNLNWRESMLRMENRELTLLFKKIFNQDFHLYNRYIFSQAYYTRHIRHRNYEIIRDVPNIAIKKINRKFIQMIKEANHSVIIETPYFLPGFMLRKALMDSAEKGVKITVMLPKKSDVNLVDILRNKYLGPLYKKGVEFLFYEPNNLHSKLILVDNEWFGVGSSNFDYRSFRYMFEIMLFGNEPEIARQILEHAEITKKSCIPFAYKSWIKRPPIEKFFEWILLPFRHLL